MKTVTLFLSSAYFYVFFSEHHFVVNNTREYSDYSVILLHFLDFKMQTYISFSNIASCVASCVAILKGNIALLNENDSIVFLYFLVSRQ